MPHMYRISQSEGVFGHEQLLLRGQFIIFLYLRYCLAAIDLRPVIWRLYVRSVHHSGLGEGGGNCWLVISWLVILADVNHFVAII